MKIQNFRAGFATNSSSSHSVVLISPDMIGKVSTIDPAGGPAGGYGWDYFRLVTPEDKLRYLCAQFFSTARDTDLRQSIIDRVTQEVPSLKNTPLDQDGYDSDLYVDHQSVWHMGINDEIVERMVKFFMSPRVVILGGNDNSDSDSNAIEGAETLHFIGDLATDGDSQRTRIRLDGDYWIAFSLRDGTKTRFSLESDTVPYLKANAPELVDLKITNYCDVGCAFCYQSSTIKGKHAPYERITQYVDLLKEADNFEIAIGGGEPTEHPDFARILTYIDEAGMVPNFTTLSDKWLKDETICAAVIKTVGGIGVSCQTAADLELVRKINSELRAFMTNNRMWYRRNLTIMAQHVVGSVPLFETGEFLRQAMAEEIPVLLLGYKEIGFGKKFQRQDGGEAAMFLKLALEGPVHSGISFDTALVNQYPDLLKMLDIPAALVSSPEGKFSCYLDAVTGKMGPSSYVEPKTMTSVPDNVAELKEIFAQY